MYYISLHSASTPVNVAGKRHMNVQTAISRRRAQKMAPTGRPPTSDLWKTKKRGWTKYRINQTIINTNEDIKRVTHNVSFTLYLLFSLENISSLYRGCCYMRYTINCEASPLSNDWTHAHTRKKYLWKWLSSKSVRQIKIRLRNCACLVHCRMRYMRCAWIGVCSEWAGRLDLYREAAPYRDIDSACEHPCQRSMVRAPELVWLQLGL